ncbi:MAG: HDIG domain-containing protein [Bacteroidia bacterium]|nr:HDIG domain-containing protein [Bacteroidia bacterium]
MKAKTSKTSLQVSQHTLIRWGLFASFIILVTLVMPKFQGISLKYEVGKPWQAADLRANFDFPTYKSPRTLEDERIQARKSVKPVFLKSNPAAERSRDKVEEALDKLEEDLRHHQEVVKEWKQDSPAESGFFPAYKTDPNAILKEYSTPGNYLNFVSGLAENLVNNIYETGYLDQPLTAIPSDIVSLREENNVAYFTEAGTLLSRDDLRTFLEENYSNRPAYDRAILNAVVLENLEPNYVFSDSLTRIEEKRLIEAISPVFGKTSEGDLIVQRGELVTLEIDATLKSYIRSRADKMGQPNYFRVFVGQFLVVMLISLLLGLLIRINRPRIYFRNRRLALIMLLMTVVMGMAGLMIRLAAISLDEFEVSFIYIVPVCMVPIMLTAFFDIQMGFFGNIIIALLIGLIIPNGFEYFFVQMCAGSISVYSLTKLRNRGEFFLTLSLILLAYIVAWSGYGYFSKGSFAAMQYGNLVLFVLNVLLTFITYPLIYIFERVFKITSDLTYVELLDTNHPLLKELALRAPGTFQHSLQVANISEAVVNRIGGNSLQTRVGGLFHDIGKMVTPIYFVENQSDGVNPHDSLPFQESARIIIKHVPEGVRLGLEYNLPLEIIDFIRTHHGTSRTEYFYRKYMEEHPEEEVDPAPYTYPGPLPFSRETAVVMIVDSIEAAARSMKTHSQEGLEALVENIVETKIRNHQFENSSLTFRDLVEIKTVILDNLRSIYHERIEYPAEVKK